MLFFSSYGAFIGCFKLDNCSNKLILFARFFNALSQKQNQQNIAIGILREKMFLFNFNEDVTGVIISGSDR